MPTKKKLKKSAELNGVNIRFSYKAYKVLKAFVGEKGYKLGSFCEIAALEKMRVESQRNS